MLSKFRSYLKPIIVLILTLCVLSIITHFNNICKSSLLSSVIAVGTSLSCELIICIFNKIHKKHLMKVISFDQIDEDMCQLNVCIGDLNYESRILFEDLRNLNQRDTDLFSHRIQSLINATIDKLWELKISSNKTANIIASRFSDVVVNLRNLQENNGIRRKTFNNLEKDICQIADGEFNLPDKYFDDIYTKKFLRHIIIDDNLGSYRGTLMTKLKYISSYTLKDIDKIRKLRIKLSKLL